MLYNLYIITKGVVKMAVSKAHIKASNKYNKENYKKIQANVKPEDYTMIDDYCKKNDISKAKFIVEACKYYIENHNEKP